VCIDAIGLAEEPFCGRNNADGWSAQQGIREAMIRQGFADYGWIEAEIGWIALSISRRIFDPSGRGVWRTHLMDHFGGKNICSSNDARRPETFLNRSET
jgi:hypothetical protein